jgi:HEAT repeat protein
LRTAEKVFPATEDPESPFLAFDEAHLARWQGNVLRALGDRAAVSPLRAALQSMDGSFNRASASLHTDLAAVLVDVGDQDEAKQHMATARKLIATVGSIRQQRRLQLVRIAA